MPRSDHPISRSQISENAVKVLYRLHKAGYKAFLVGGGVRDLLLGREPKDFDVATDATPEEVNSLFRNCRLVGRRFRLAHVHFGREIIEVATFRAAHEGEQLDGHSKQSDDGMLLRDNVYGSLEDDALRRDLTVNALYYNIADFSIVDYADGVADLKKGVLRMLGDPETRYREDPVRMLRAVRFGGKLGFTLTQETEEPIWELGELLQSVPSARLFDESLKLFMGGSCEETFHLLRHYYLIDYLFPMTEEAINSMDGEPFLHMICDALYNTDQRIATGKPVTPAFLFAVFLWEPVRRLYEDKLEAGEPPLQAIQRAGSQIVSEQVQHVAIPKRFTLMMKDIWNLQPRFLHREGKRPLRLLTHPKFRAAYDFMLLRVTSGEVEQELADWWTEIQSVDQDAKEKMTRPSGGNRGRRRRTRPKQNQGEAQ
ncbi:poly(A) polymerase [Solemya velum gill symbiont]|nr:poly(A) polymerase [Solemya velum gill symbiont]OOZ49907.1 poly(A) polymerase [Solemya velum gill symbiont]OOZ51644.1 poly(A) polymerase [Solemya velum gill symbiont]OOZ55559.1 poly(A) polymerase [Solemya velum gill symbiont]